MNQFKNKLSKLCENTNLFPHMLSCEESWEYVYRSAPFKLQPSFNPDPTTKAHSVIAKCIKLGRVNVLTSAPTYTYTGFLGWKCKHVGVQLFESKRIPVSTKMSVSLTLLVDPVDDPSNCKITIMLTNRLYPQYNISKYRSMMTWDSAGFVSVTKPHICNVRYANSYMKRNIRQITATITYNQFTIAMFEDKLRTSNPVDVRMIGDPSKIFNHGPLYFVVKTSVSSFDSAPSVFVGTREEGFVCETPSRICKKNIIVAALITHESLQKYAEKYIRFASDDYNTHEDFVFTRIHTHKLVICNSHSRKYKTVVDNLKRCCYTITINRVYFNKDIAVFGIRSIEPEIPYNKRFWFIMIGIVRPSDAQEIFKRGGFRTIDVCPPLEITAGLDFIMSSSM
jgi:hypothetical protein